MMCVIVLSTQVFPQEAVLFITGLTLPRGTSLRSSAFQSLEMGETSGEIAKDSFSRFRHSFLPSRLTGTPRYAGKRGTCPFIVENFPFYFCFAHLFWNFSISLEFTHLMWNFPFMAHFLSICIGFNMI